MKPVTLLYRGLVVYMLGLSVALSAAAGTRAVAITATDEATPINLPIEEGEAFSLRIGGVTGDTDWNGVSVSLQIKAGLAGP